MQVQPRLLDHPFYQAWNRGEVDQDTLAAYHRSYAALIQRIPTYWQKVVNAFQPEHPLGLSIVQDERDHILLWEAWGRSLRQPAAFPPMQELISALEQMTPSELLGALQAFEMQQPEVAASKKAGLLRHYGFMTEDLRYFDEHLKEEMHIAYGASLAEKYAEREEFESGFRRGAELVYRSLDEFVPRAAA